MKSSWILDRLNDPSVFPEETYLDCRKKTKVKDGMDVTSMVLIFKTGKKGVAINSKREK